MHAPLLESDFAVAHRALLSPIGPCWSPRRALCRPSGLAGRPVGPLLVAPSGLAVAHRAVRTLTVDDDLMRPLERSVLAVEAVAVAVLLGEPLRELGLVGERRKLDGDGAHLLLCEECLAARQELGLHRRWDAGGDRA
eukprot:574921-Prymnesium_polylepis.1